MPKPQGEDQGGQKVTPTNLPPTYDRAGTHGVYPKVGHDDRARFNFLANLNMHIGRRIAPGNKLAFDARVTPAFRHATGRDFQSSTEIRDAMRSDPHYQQWAALRRNSMEMRQQNGRSIVLNQLNDLNAKADDLNNGRNTLQLDDRVEIPSYLAKVDNHCMPGSYYTEVVDKDVSAAANYECGLFASSAGAMSHMGDIAGRGVVAFVKETYPEFRPKRIMDLGAGIGGNTLPLAAAYPDAEVYAVDVAAPMLRYGHARAQSLGFTNVKFVQMALEDLDFEAESFDWIQTTMVWHETSGPALRTGLEQIYNLLAPSGMTLNLEQPNFDETTSLYDRFLRDWDAYYNNEPFWTKLHKMSMPDALVEAGFERDKVIEAGCEGDLEPGKYQPWAAVQSRHAAEKTKPNGDSPKSFSHARWYLFGAWK